MVILYIVWVSLAHHQEFRNCVCSQVSYSIILDSVFCLSHAVSVQGFVHNDTSDLHQHSVNSEWHHNSQRTPPRGQPSHTYPGSTKPYTDTARDKQKTESRIIQYDTWLHTQFPELLMMSEWRSKHVEHYHQIKSITSCISLVIYMINCPILCQKWYRVQKLTIRECRRNVMWLKNLYNPPSIISEIGITELDRNFKFWHYLHKHFNELTTGRLHLPGHSPAHFISGSIKKKI